VIGYRFGAVPEVVDEGVTGFVVDGAEAAIAAVGLIDTLDRAGVRKRFEERFTDTRMAAAYIDIYRERLRAAAL
jgi:glycosyltransferase involved in cell wall biosynthesis